MYEQKITPELMAGMVSNIQHCSVHDGPGIRTTVFLKGCNMRCQWCHNPETISFEKEILFYPEKCIGCGMCEEGCFAGAKVPCGDRLCVDEVFKDILLDQPYYGKEGGVTVSGGEPLCQPEFTRALLLKCKENGIHTAIETNLNVSYEVAFPVLAQCDFIMCDLKIINEDKHLEYTGKSNRLIKENILHLPELNTPFIVRTPVIPGVNDSIEEILSIGSFVSELEGLLYYELLPYHPLGLSKGTGENSFHSKKFEKPANEQMLALGKVLKKLPCDIRIAGQTI